MNALLSRSEALQLLVSRAVCVAYFTKKDGSRRRMLLRYEGGRIRGSLVEVWDAEKGAPRMLNLATLEALKAMPTRAADRPAAPGRGFEDVRRELHDLF